MSDPRTTALVFRTCVLLCLVAPPGAIEAAVFHVARNESGASDDNDGLVPKFASGHHGPWKSIAKAASAASPGDTVLVYEGDYRQEASAEGPGRIAIGRSGASAPRPIVFAAAPGQKPLVKSLLVHDCQWIVIRGFQFVNPDYTLPENWKDMPAVLVEDPDVKIDPKEPWSTREPKVNRKYATFTRIVKDFQSVYSSGIDIKHSSGIRVEGNTVSGYSLGIQVKDGSSNVVIEGNRISHCLQGIFTWRPRPSLAGGVIRNNVLDQNLTTGIVLREEAHDVLVEGNRLRHTGMSHITLIHGVRDCTVRGNVAEYGGYYSEAMRNPGSSAINVNSCREGIVVERNFAACQIDLTGNDGNGFIADLMLDGAGVLFRNNVAWRNMGPGFTTTESPNCRFLNNTMVENGYHAVNPRSGAGIRLARPQDVGQVILNNIFSNNASAGIKSSETIARQKLIDDNVYYASNGAPLIWDAYQFGDRAYKTIDDIRKHTPWERHGRSGDPRFVDPRRPDFHLGPASPAIGAGQASPDVVDDFAGKPRPRQAACDAGAFESGAAKP